jgi:SAM-dependent methyltransferase
MKNYPNNIDKAGKNYWNKTPRNNIKYQTFFVQNGIRGYSRRQFKKLFDDTFSYIKDINRIKLLKLGCGGSIYLPYFSKTYNCIVSGVDYSETGCILSDQICNDSNVDADIICADIFNPPDYLIEKFDVVVSFGVFEHFSDSDHTMSAFSRFLRPGGVLLTVVPNMSGITGFIQKIISHNIYDVHEKIDVERFIDSNKFSDLEIVKINYFQFINFGVINPGDSRIIINTILMFILRVVSIFIWFIEFISITFKPNFITSPYIYCISRKKYLLNDKY